MFEVHITIQSIEEPLILDFVDFCRSINVKPILIELEKGEVAQQPMISKVFKGIEKGGLKKEINKLVENFEKWDYEVKRIKVEVPLDFIEQGRAEFPTYRGQYFEWHGKIEFEDLDALKEMIRIKNVHLSNNSLKGQVNRRFLTLRFYGHKNTFINEIKNLKIYLKVRDVELIKDEYEYCVYDSNKSIDKGWIDTPEITDNAYLELLAFEGFLRRVVDLDEKFVLKGSMLMRQCLLNKEKRVARDLDFLYAEFIDTNQEAAKIFSSWVTKVTEVDLDDGIQFRSFRENDFWREIDYAMNDDFPTTNTDLYCVVHGQLISALGLDISWNLPLGEEPEPIIYDSEKGEPFIIPYTVPIPVQVSWKLHQSIVRPRSKDFLDIILLLEDNQLTENELRIVARNFVEECIKDKINPKRLIHYVNGGVSDYFEEHEEEIKEIIYTYKDQNSPFGFRINYELRIEYLNDIFKIDRSYNNILELITEFEQILQKNRIGDYVLELEKRLGNDLIWSSN